MIFKLIGSHTHTQTHSLSHTHTPSFLTVGNLRVVLMSAALSALTPTSFQLRLASCDTEADPVPVTSLLCKWKAPNKRTLPIAEATIEKHDYAKPMNKTNEKI